MNTPTTRRAMRPAETASYLGMGLSSLWAKCKADPAFPQPIKLAPRTTVFYREEVDAYLDACAQRSRAA